MRAGALALVLLTLTACVSEESKAPTPGWSFEGLEDAGPQVAVGPPPEGKPPVDEDLLRLLTPATEADLGPDFLADQPPSPFHRLGRDVIRGLDGSWTKMYTLRAGRGQDVVELLKAYIPGFPDQPNTPSDPAAGPTEVIKWVLHDNFYKDDVPTSFGSRETLGGSANVADVLHVTAPPDTLLFIDELLKKVLGDLPQIELQVRVVEINLDDVLEWDAKVVARQLEDRALPFDSVTNPVAGHFGAGIPILDNGEASGIGAGFNSFSGAINLSGFLLSLQGVHDNISVDSVLSLLQTIGAAELISSPSITVLDGHRARLVTGDKVPVFQASGNVNNPNVVTNFEQTGVTIEMVPFLVADDLVRVDLSVDVSAQTGSVPFVLSGADVSAPVISQRAAGTTVHVYAGQVFALGGLKASTTLETVTKVPLLGDIPILGWFFKSRKTQKQNTEILFFITPVIHIPSETLLNPLGS